ncbi:MAG: hypothetical protein ACI37Z_05020 [Candidatus Gastranaerophilaceae bacterium]
MGFNVGDKVVVVDKNIYSNEYSLFGKHGTVIFVDYNVYVEFNEFIGGHDGDGYGKQGYCWCLLPQWLAKTDIKIGDKVKILAKESAYLNFRDWINKNAPEYANLYREDVLPRTVCEYRLLKKAPAAEFFPFNQKTLCLIENNKTVFIVPLETIYKEIFNEFQIG